MPRVSRTSAVSPNQPLLSPNQPLLGLLLRCRSRRCRCLPRRRPRPVARRLLCAASSPCACPVRYARQKPQAKKLQAATRLSRKRAFFFARLSRFRSVLRSAACSRCCCFSCSVPGSSAAVARNSRSCSRFLPCLESALCLCLERLLVHAFQPELLPSPCLRGRIARVSASTQLSTLGADAFVRASAAAAARTMRYWWKSPEPEPAVLHASGEVSVSRWRTSNAEAPASTPVCVPAGDVRYARRHVLLNELQLCLEVLHGVARVPLRRAERQPQKREPKQERSSEEESSASSGAHAGSMAADQVTACA